MNFFPKNKFSRIFNNQQSIFNVQFYGKLNIKNFHTALGFAVFIVLIFMNGCDGGIEPQSGESGFGGKITFIGQWPDSVTRTHLVVFENPLLSAADFSLDNLRFVSNEIPFGVAEYTYTSRDSAVIPESGFNGSGQFAYVAVAQQTTQSVSLNRSDWFVSGLYYNEGDSTNPGTLIIPENTYVEDVNIVCDFNNPPQQPPGGN